MKKELNTVARDSLVHQITELMDDLRVAMNYLEQARNSSYTEGMDEVRTVLNIASKRIGEPNNNRALNLAGVASQIHEGEIDGSENGKGDPDSRTCEVLSEAGSNGAATPKKQAAKKQLRISRK